MHYDVFNGDADGLCALHQLRLATPIDGALVTGVKRDIKLLSKVARDATSVTVLDISLAQNVAALQSLLERGVPVQYFDHHYPGTIPESAKLDCHIDTAATVCTGLLVNQYLGGTHLPWAVTAAFGDNLNEVAISAAAPLQLDTEQIDALQTLGMLMNYNGYGASLDDLMFAPDSLYRAIKPHESPFSFIDSDPAFTILQAGYNEDSARVNDLQPEIEDDVISVIKLPNAAWARRVSGVYANQLARDHPGRAHALLTEKAGGYLVSVRAPLHRREGADTVCRQFESGGGRAAAAGINTLPEADVDRLIACLRNTYTD